MNSHIAQIENEQARAFAVACYDTNSGSELVNAAMVEPDESVMQAWCIDERQYFAAINAALADMEQDEREAAGAYD